MKTLHFFFIVILLLAGNSGSPAQIVAISQDGGDVVLAWEGDGVVQLAPEITGPWMDDLEATSSHRVMITGDRLFVRIFYPNGYQVLSQGSA